MTPTPEDYIDTAKRAMSAAIRELMSAKVFMERAGQDQLALRIDRLFDDARHVRSQMEKL
jgi:hypothetical protein